MRNYTYNDIEPQIMERKGYNSSKTNERPAILSPIHTSAIEICHGMKIDEKSALRERVTYERVELSNCRINPFDFTLSSPNETVERVVNLLSKISAQYYHPWTKEMKMTLKNEVTDFVSGWELKYVPRFRDFERFLENRISERMESSFELNKLSHINTSLQLFDRHRILSCVQIITQLQSPLKTYFHDTTSVPLLQSNHYLHIVVLESKTAWEELLLAELINHYQKLFNRPIKELKDGRGFICFLNDLTVPRPFVMCTVNTE